MLHNWQYLFVIEGIATTVAGAAAWFWLPSGPGTAWFLSLNQRAFAAMRMQLDSARYVQQHRGYDQDGLEKVSGRLSWRDIVETAKDWKMWFALACNICASVPGQAFSVFLPLVVKGLGYEAIEVNLVSLFSTALVGVSGCNRSMSVDVGPSIRMWCNWAVPVRGEL